MKLLITVEGVQYEVDVQVLDDSGAAAAPAAASAPAAQPAAPAAAAGGEAKAPIAGSVLDVKVNVGDKVNVNDPLLVLEAMKMESVVASPQAGQVREILVKSGDNVTAGQVLVRF